MRNLLRELYIRYNEFDQEHHIYNDTVVLRVLKDGATSTEDLESKIEQYNRLENDKKMNSTSKDLIQFIDSEQPRAYFLNLIYLDLILDSMDDNFFEEIHLSRNKILMIVSSISFYMLTLQTLDLSNMVISKNARDYLFKRGDYFLGLDELNSVCGKITQEDYKIFLKLFSFDIKEKVIDNRRGEKLFSDGSKMYILSIDEFTEWFNLNVELMFKKSCSEKAFSHYTLSKGFGFEELVFQFIAPITKTIAHSINYYPVNDKVYEIDILIQENENLIICECKSGTINLRDIRDNTELRVKIDNKVKKAYKTLTNASKYVTSSDEYEFKNEDKVIRGISSDTEVACINISMYPMDVISSSIHTLNQKYLDVNNNILTISFEHFLAIYFDCYNRNIPISSYFKKRDEMIKKFPNIKFDNNELDLYYQIMNINTKSMLSESLENGFLDQFNDDIQIISSFTNSENEFRPASQMLNEMNQQLLNTMIEHGREKLGLNRRFLKYFDRIYRVI